MELTNDQLQLLRRYKGELNLNIGELAETLGVNRHTASKILAKGGNVNTYTANKINDFINRQTILTK